MELYPPESQSPIRGRGGKTGTPFGARPVASGCGAPWRALALLLLIGAGAGAPALAAGPTEKVRIGAVENVVLLPWGVMMPARIDTGAATSSLDARNLTVKGKMVEFNLPPQYGGRRVVLPIYKWRTVKSSEAQDHRPVVIVEMCIGEKRVRTHVNLNDRANVKYPLLIGRNTLKHGFLVECSASYCTQPSCPEVKTK